MLRPPHQRYQHLWVYHLDYVGLPEIKHPDLIGVWIEDDTSVLFFHTDQQQLVDQLCQSKGCTIIYQADLSYEEWEAGQQITSFTVGSFSVAPVWEQAEADIHLDPSVIFGSGFHPTTRTCLSLVDKYIRAPELTFRSMLDLGTGTGLLAIAAARHGVEQIKAVDNNPLACEVALANCRLNNVEEQITVAQQDLLLTPPETKGFDLVVANLYRGLLEKLFSDDSFWQAEMYILSGFIKSMEADLLAALPARQIKFLERTRQENWCLWVLAPTQSRFLKA